MKVGQPNILTGLRMNPASSLMRASPILTELECCKLLDDLVLMIFFGIECMLSTEARLRDTSNWNDPGSTPSPQVQFSNFSEL